MNKHEPDPARAERRAAAERMIRRYPDLTEEELAQLLHYMRKEASAMDCAVIASNEDLRQGYEQLCNDHYLNRLKPLEVALTIFFLLGLVSLLVFAHEYAKIL